MISGHSKTVSQPAKMNGGANGTIRNLSSRCIYEKNLTKLFGNDNARISFPLTYLPTLPPFFTRSKSRKHAGYEND